MATEAEEASGPPDARSSSRAPKGISRERVMEAALMLFLKRGYQGTPVRELSETLGMSKANIYHHFPTKEKLLRELLDPLFGRMGELLDRHLPAPNGSPEQRALLEEYFDLILENRRLVALLASDAGVLAIPDIGDLKTNLDDRLTALVAGSEPGLEGQVRAACALGALQTAAIRFYQADPEAVRLAGLAAARGALGVR